MGAFLGNLYSRGGERQFMRAGIIYSRNQDNRSGPFSYILADLTKLTGKASEDLPVENSFQISQRPVISVDQYNAMAEQKPHHQWNVVLLTVESLTRRSIARLWRRSRGHAGSRKTRERGARFLEHLHPVKPHQLRYDNVPLSSHYPLRSATMYAYPKNPTYPRVLIYDLLKAIGYRTAIFSSSNENWGGMNNYLETGNLDRFIHAANSKKPDLSHARRYWIRHVGKRNQSCREPR